MLTLSRKLPHDRAIQLLTFFGGLPGVLVCIVLLWAGDWTPKVQWTFSTRAVGVWLGCVVAVRERVIYPMQTLTNLLAALREGDYSLRSRRARRDDALGEVMREINFLGETLLVQRREATEAAALLRAVMTEIDVAVFTFDNANHLRLVNRAGAQLLAQPEAALLGRAAADLGLADCLAENAPDRGVLARTFPGRPAGAGSDPRWGMRRTRFRENGRPHQLLVIADLSRALREEERAAWQRLVRVLGHEINNSLAPIQSIAGSLLALVRRPAAARAEDWREDVEGGLEVIAARAEALGRFLSAYARLARLPAPQRRPAEVSALVRHAAALETRLAVRCQPDGPRIEVNVDADQIEQVLINLLHNAVDAASAESGGAAGEVSIGWNLESNGAFSPPHAAIFIDDTGSGLASSANLFVPFFTTKPHGSGIGLVLSRQIAEAHGGTLSLANRPDGRRGCRATLRLPLG
ncbi:MAG: PAS domain-containing sensor histidine kinase [Verrucomicrobia bacterium]|nr:PAS domain-containing sensor histidine kinase [Verrucomicrobiota bacterium]